MASVGLPAIGEAASPGADEKDDALNSIEPAANAASQYFYSTALSYAGTKGLTYMNKSSVFRSIMRNSRWAGDAAEASPFETVVVYPLALGVIAEARGCL